MDGGEYGGVAKLGLSSNNAVGDVVVNSLFSVYQHIVQHHPTSSRYTARIKDVGGTLDSSYAVLLLFDLKLSAVLESPLDNVGIVASALHPLAGLQSRPPVGKVLD